MATPSPETSPGGRGRGRRRAILESVLDALIFHEREEGGVLPDPRRVGAVDALERLVERLPPGDRRRFRALVFFLEWGAALRTQRRFSRLDVAARRRCLERWGDSRLRFRRQGYFALKSLGMLAYYTRPETWPAIGYDGPYLGRIPVEVLPVPRPAEAAGPPARGAGWDRGAGAREPL